MKVTIGDESLDINDEHVFVLGAYLLMDQSRWSHFNGYKHNLDANMLQNLSDADPIIIAKLAKKLLGQSDDEARRISRRVLAGEMHRLLLNNSEDVSDLARASGGLRGLRDDFFRERNAVRDLFRRLGANDEQAAEFELLLGEDEDFEVQFQQFVRNDLTTLEGGGDDASEFRERVRRTNKQAVKYVDRVVGELDSKNARHSS